jgi:protein TonB
MQSKKSEKSNLENYSKLFILLGLTLSLFFAYSALEYETADGGVGDGEAYTTNMKDDEEDVPETVQELEIEPPKPQDAAPPPPVLEELEVVEDDAEVEEAIIQSTETDETEEIEIEEIEEVEIVEEVVEDVSFRVIEDAPIFPGCKGNKAAVKKCFSSSVNKFVAKKFNTELAQELGLSPGKKRISVQFTVGKSGQIQDIRVRAPHKRLEKEARRVVGLLPKITPGKQRGKPVGVKFTLPIVFEVMDDF